MEYKVVISRVEHRKAPFETDVRAQGQVQRCADSEERRGGRVPALVQIATGRPAWGDRDTEELFCRHVLQFFLDGLDLFCPDIDLDTPCGGSTIHATTVLACQAIESLPRTGLVGAGWTLRLSEVFDDRRRGRWPSLQPHEMASDTMGKSGRLDECRAS